MAIQVDSRISALNNGDALEYKPSNNQYPSPYVSYNDNSTRGQNLHKIKSTYQVKNSNGEWEDAKFYDCLIPYNLTYDQLKGYVTDGLVDTETGTQHPGMRDYVKSRNVACKATLQQFDKYGDLSFGSYQGKPLLAFDVLEPYIQSGKITRELDDTNAYVLSKNGAKVYQSAMSPFFGRFYTSTQLQQNNGFRFADPREIPITSATDPRVPWSSPANRGQFFDIILTNGKVIHFVIVDTGQMKDTINGFGNRESGKHYPIEVNPNTHIEDTPDKYSIYSNITSNVSGCTLEMRGKTVFNGTDNFDFIQSFARKYGIGTDLVKDGTGQTAYVAIVRMYKANIRDDNFRVREGLEGVPYYDLFADGSTDWGDIKVPSAEEYGSGVSVLVPQEQEEPELKGIKNLKINYATWVKGTGLSRIGDERIFQVKKTVAPVGRTKQYNDIWKDISPDSNGEMYSKSELASKFGIIYDSVAANWKGKFTVRPKPLSVERGGTGVSSMAALVKILSPYFSGETETPSLPQQTESIYALDTVDIPQLNPSQITTVEAIASVNGSSVELGDQAQSFTARELRSDKSFDNKGEVQICYNTITPLNNAKALYRYTGYNYSSSAEKDLCKRISRCAANLACFAAQNEHIGCFATTSSQALWNYITAGANDMKAVKITEFSTDVNLSPGEFCRYMYLAAMPPLTKKTQWKINWNPSSILSGNLLESLGFTKIDKPLCNSFMFYDIGDIWVTDNHMGIVVDVYGKDYAIGDINYDPRLSEGGMNFSWNPIQVGTDISGEERIKRLNQLFGRTDYPEGRWEGDETLREFRKLGTFTEQIEVKAKVPNPDQSGPLYIDGYVTLTVHKNLVSNIKELFAELYDIGFPIISAIYAYEVRAMVSGGGQYISDHSYGVCMDINAPKNPPFPSTNPYPNGYGDADSTYEIGQVRPDVEQIFANHGFAWGGRWGGGHVTAPDDVATTGSKDFPHFTYTGR